MLYLRFAGFDRDERTLCSVGMFQIAYGLLRSELDSYVRVELGSCIRWLEENLVQPSRLYRPGRQRYAISWFQPGARAEMAMARRLVAAIEEAGVPMRTLRTATPGYVVYRDAKQVVAVRSRRVDARGKAMSTHEASRRWPVCRDRFLEGVVAALWRRRQAVARCGLDVHFGQGVYCEWLEVNAPQRCDRAVVLELHVKNRGHVYVERVRRRRRTILLRLEDLWFVGAPTRLVEAFEQCLQLVSSQCVWGAVEQCVRAVWDEVTLRPE